MAWHASINKLVASSRSGVLIKYSLGKDDCNPNCESSLKLLHGCCMVACYPVPVRPGVVSVSVCKNKEQRSFNVFIISPMMPVDGDKPLCFCKVSRDTKI